MYRSWPQLDDIRGKVIFVLVDKYGKYGPMYRTLFPGLRNGTFFVSQPGEGSYQQPSNITVLLQVSRGGMMSITSFPGIYLKRSCVYMKM